MTPRPPSRRQIRCSTREAPRGRVRLARRLVAAGAATVAALVGALLVGASPAVAGGPTSVLIVNYDQSRASGALTGSPAYESLSRALDVMNAPVGESRPKDSFMSSQLRLTWMIHDVSPWRIDAIYLDGKDVWVSTTLSYDSTSLFDKPAIWHRPADATLLVDTLTSLGVIGDAPSSSATPRSTATAAPAAQSAPTAPTASRVSSGYPWWLTLVAAIAALGVGFVVGRARRPGAGVPATASDDDGMPASAPGASGQGGAPTFQGGTDEQARPAPVGFTSD
ncbi:hypothetical protein GCM10027053_40550 [Intrasporangium mesophilum]